MNYIPAHCKFNLYCVCPEAVWGECPPDWTPRLRSLPTIAGSSGASWLQWNSHEQSPPIWMDQVQIFFHKRREKSTPREHNSVEGIIFMRNVVSQPPLCCSIGFHNNGEVIIERRVPLSSNLILLYVFCKYMCSCVRFQLQIPMCFGTCGCRRSRSSLSVTLHPIFKDRISH